MVIFARAVKERRTAMTTVARRIFLEIKTGRLSLYSHAHRQLSYKVLTLPRNFSRFFWAWTENFSGKKKKHKETIWSNERQEMLCSSCLSLSLVGNSMRTLGGITMRPLCERELISNDFHTPRKVPTLLNFQQQLPKYGSFLPHFLPAPHLHFYEVFFLVSIHLLPSCVLMQL